MCFAQCEFVIGEQDVQLGVIADAPFYISRPQFEYWKHTQLIIDVVPGRGGMFSLENGEGVRFLTRSRLFTEAEFAELAAAGRGWGDRKRVGAGKSDAGRVGLGGRRGT